MKFFAVTHAAGHGHSLEKGLAVIREIGFDGILLLTGEKEPVRPDGTCPDLFPDFLRSEPAHVRKAMDNAGLELGAVHYPISRKLDVKSDEGAEKSARDLAEFAERVLEAGCRHLTHTVPRCGRAHIPTEEKVPELERLARIMDSTAKAFSEKNLKVACDIHYTQLVEGLEDCRYLLNSMSCENAGLLMNVGHLTTAQAYGWILVDEYPSRIPVIGWKDHSLAASRPKDLWSVEIGTGHTPLELYSEVLKRNPAERLNMVNCENEPEEIRAEALGRSLEYVKKILAGE